MVQFVTVAIANEYTSQMGKREGRDPRGFWIFWESPSDLLY